MVVAFCLIYFVWGTTFFAIRVMVATVPPFLSAALRFLLAGSILLGIARIGGPLRITPRQVIHTALVSALMFLIGYGGLFWAEQSVDSGIAALLAATIPIWIALLEISILKKGRIRASLVAAIVVGLSGVALLTVPSGRVRVPLVPIAVLMVGQMSWALGTILSRKLSLPDRKVVSAALQMLVGGVLLFTVAFGTGDVKHGLALQSQAIAALLYLAIPGSVLAFTAYIWLLARISPTVVGSYAYVNPVVALLVGHLLGGEPLTARTVAGSSLIVLSVAVTLLYGATAHKSGVAEAANEVRPRQ